jgi:hypothetical protein
LVPAAGIATDRLVAPGAISPVSTEPSFKTTRCMTESLFLNTTVWPPSAAGLGENAWAPFCPTIEMVAAEGPEGAAGEDDPPPQLVTASAAQARASIRNCDMAIILQSSREHRESAEV